MPDEPDLHESAWTRAKTDAALIYRSATFWVGATIVQLVAISLSILLADEKSPTKDRIAVPILVGALMLAITFLSVLVVRLALAPVAQRNEVRAMLSRVGSEADPSVAQRKREL